MLKRFELIVTIGPAILGTDKLREIDSCGKCIFRINGAHTDVETARRITKTVRGVLPEARIMIDLPGAKLRTSNLPEPIRLVKGDTFELSDYQINYPEAITLIKPGDEILANDSNYWLEVTATNGRSVKIFSHCDGLLDNNKGLHIKGLSEKLPFFFERDIELIRWAGADMVDYISLSYVRDAEDVQQATDILAKNGNTTAQLIAKIETSSAVENLDGILEKVSIVNIDRGDLSTEIGMLELPFTQEKIIEKSMKAEKKVFLATQFLKNMESHPVPLIAEMTDLCKTIQQGVSGIQLSEETAIGRYPVECARLVFDIYNRCVADVHHASGADALPPRQAYE